MNFDFSEKESIIFTLLSLTQRMGCGSILVGSDGNVISYNNAAANIICSFTSETALSDASVRKGIKSLLSKSDSRFVLNEESWAVINRIDARPIALHAIPSGDKTDRYMITLIIIIDLSEDRAPNNEALQKMFGLTPSEINVSIQIAKGKTLSEISKENKTTLWTVRSQLASIFSKTQTKRQSELVGLLLKISMLS